MKDRPEALQEVAATGETEPLPPGTPIGMAIGAEIAPSHPAPIRTVRIGTAMGRGIDLTAASSRHHHARWRSAGGLWARVTAVLTGVAGRLYGEARKGLALTMVLWHGGCGRWCRRTRGGVAGPHPLEHTAQPQHGDQR
jgi:hypothetical protein